jgi:hypothetical protein
MIARWCQMFEIYISYLHRYLLLRRSLSIFHAITNSSSLFCHFLHVELLLIVFLQVKVMS